jgi:hypothetical protein
MSNITPKPREIVKEGAAEVREKLKADLSHWSRARRLVSLRPTMGCLSCDATGKLSCASCGGSGEQKLVWNDEVSACPTCEGKGIATCADCAGRGFVKNTHRKKWLWVLGIGGAAWALLLWRIWGDNIAPEAQAKYLHGGGGGGGANVQRSAPPSSMRPNRGGPGGARNGMAPGGGMTPGGATITPGNNPGGTQ